MAGTTAEAQVAKKCYKNQTAGWLGVVKLDHLGAQQGAPVKPYGTVYLSDEEAILTARAPADPKDNPFVEQEFAFQDAAGKVVRQGMRPLVLISDEREVPSDDRFVPGLADVDGLPPTSINTETAAAGVAQTKAALDAESDREVPTEPVEPVLVPAMAAAVDPAHASATAPTPPAAAEPAKDGEPESWVDNAARTEAPQAGSLGGSNEPAPYAVDGDPVTTGSPTGQSVQAPVRQPVQPPAPSPSEQGSPFEGEVSRAGVPLAEEHAGVTPKDEETGAAQTAVGTPPEGEFAAHEEVGSPDAPSKGVTADV